MKKNIILLFENFNEELITPEFLESGIKTIGLHYNPYKNSATEYFDFIEKNQEFIIFLESKEVIIEYYFHAVSVLLNRELFKKKPHFFRVDQNGQRNPDFNCCPSNKRALKIIEHNAYKLAKKLGQKSHRYHLWLDDDLGNDISCQCENCRKLTLQKQNLLLLTAILKGVKKYDKMATISYLIYGNEELKEGLSPDFFIEFAPFKRRHDVALNHHENEAWIKKLELLKKISNFEVIEYFLSYNLKDYLDCSVRVDNDLETYHKLGIKNIATFVVNNGLSIGDIRKAIMKFVED
ncbi:MAG: hypothetical protein ACOX3K_02275 [Bacilli bacterium]|jgi:hypothetical protein